MTCAVGQRPFSGALLHVRDLCSEEACVPLQVSCALPALDVLCLVLRCCCPLQRLHQGSSQPTMSRRSALPAHTGLTGSRLGVSRQPAAHHVVLECWQRPLTI